MNSEKAVQFRKWETEIVKEFTIKAYVMDDERLKKKVRKLYSIRKHKLIVHTQLTLNDPCQPVLSQPLNLLI
jgi:hypothetical protein